LLSKISCHSPSKLPVPPFEEANAYRYLVKQCDFGPRNPGSEGHRACLNYLTAELRKYADRVRVYNFVHYDERLKKNIPMANIIANFQPEKGERLLFSAHWDTRPWADQDPNPANRAKPILGANDGASGVAVLLEVARVLKAHPPTVGVDLIFFDGEDYGDAGNAESFSIGSKEFAQNRDPNYLPKYGVLLDMVGDADLLLYQEGNSVRYAPEVVNRVWGKARELGIQEFIPEVGYEVSMDDHLRLLAVGIPCIDVIDFNYRYWHTLQDTPDKCSAASLGKVGRVMLGLIYQ